MLKNGHKIRAYPMTFIIFFFIAFVTCLLHSSFIGMRFASLQDPLNLHFADSKQLRNKTKPDKKTWNYVSMPPSFLFLSFLTPPLEITRETKIKSQLRKGWSINSTHLTKVPSLNPGDLVHSCGCVRGSMRGTHAVLSTQIGFIRNSLSLKAIFLILQSKGKSSERRGSDSNNTIIAIGVSHFWSPPGLNSSQQFTNIYWWKLMTHPPGKYVNSSEGKMVPCSSRLMAACRAEKAAVAGCWKKGITRCIVDYPSHVWWDKHQAISQENWF